MSWLGAHAAFGQIAMGAGAGLQKDKAGSAADQMGGVADALGGAKADEALAEWFDKLWARYTKERDLTMRAQLLVDFAVPGSPRTWLWTKALNETKAKGGTIKRGHALFVQKASAALVEQFVADPDKGLAAWLNLLSRRYVSIGTDPLTRQFRQQVEQRLIDAYVERAAAELRKELAGISQAKLNAYLDDMRHLVRDYSQKYLLIAVGALDAWDVPLVPPEKWATFLVTGGAELSGFVSGAIMLPAAAAGAAAGPALIAAVVALMVAEKAGTLYIAWSDLKEKEQEYRQAQASRSVKATLRTTWEQVSHIIENQQDLLAPLYTAGAIKAGLDLESDAQEPVRTYVWKQLFNDLPRDPTLARQRFMQELESSFKSKLAGM